MIIAVSGVITFLIFTRLFVELTNLTTFQFFGKIIPRVQTDTKVIALTFDDGPTEYTDDVLEILRENDVKATFFVIGSEMEKNPNMATEIINVGHQIANHSYTHQRNVFKSYDFYKNEVNATNKLIRAAGYKDEIMFRPPYGKKFIGLPYYLNSINMKTIIWDVEPEKYGNTKDFYLRYTLDNTRPGSIIIIHPFCGEQCKAAREALPEIISTLKADGYRFVTVKELLEYRFASTTSPFF
jgi:chitin deacetylase